MGIYTSLEHEMVCPLCGGTNTHVDGVSIAARPSGEDGAIKEIGVNSRGDVADLTGGIPESRFVGVGRRHRIALTGWCESCDRPFAWLFTQHKGVTLLEPVDLGDHPSFGIAS